MKINNDGLYDKIKIGGDQESCYLILQNVKNKNKITVTYDSIEDIPDAAFSEGNQVQIKGGFLEFV